jgi:hypothetical protein
MKYSLLNCEGDFLLVEKIGEKWFFKLLIEIKSVDRTKSGYYLEETNPIEIFNFLKGNHTLYHEQYKENINYLNYDDNYKSRTVIKGLIQALVLELYHEIQSNEDEFLKEFAIPPKRDY